MNALQSQSAAPETQLRSQLNVAQRLAELLGAITTVLNRAQAPRMLADQKGFGKPPVVSSADSHVKTKKVENFVSGVIPSVRGALSSAMESHVVTAAAVALGVLEFWR